MRARPCASLGGLSAQCTAQSANALRVSLPLGCAPQVMYLRRFKHLQLLNLAGNPISKDQEYKAYVLSHTWALKFLDYRLVDAQATTRAACLRPAQHHRAPGRRRRGGAGGGRL